jgi:transcriptional regulator GlxA family with amidase domain
MTTSTTPDDREPIPLAILVSGGATLIDFAGPWEVFASATYANCPGFDVFAVAATRDPIVCDDGRGADRPRSGLTIVPDYTFEDAPAPRMLLMGAQRGRDDPRTLEWIRQAHAKADLTMSVCTGAFLLGAAGLLDGRQATTNAKAYDSFERQFPKVQVVRGVPFVESGDIATATGLTAGIELALRVTDRVYGRAVAQKIADYEEWKGAGWKVDG